MNQEISPQTGKFFKDVQKKQEEISEMEHNVHEICFVLQKLLDGYRSNKLNEINNIVKELRFNCSHFDVEERDGFITCKDCGAHVGLGKLMGEDSGD